MEATASNTNSNVNSEWDYDKVLDEVLVEVTAGKKIKPFSHVSRSEKRRILHAFLTIRNPEEDVYSVETSKKIDWILQKELEKRGVEKASLLPKGISLFGGANIKQDAHDFLSKIVLWKGDITRLDVDAIVNAANSQMLGCFQPSHKCIDNVIHGAAGPKLRDACFKLMEEQQFEQEKEGLAKITPGYNLPSKYVLHTVGPHLEDEGEGPSDLQKQQLASCYKNCLKLAAEKNLKSIALCCISTGMFAFPGELASKIAVWTVKQWLEENPSSSIELVIFNVFTRQDHSYYKKRLEEIANTPIQTDEEDNELFKAKEWLKNADSILISGGAGLSASAGLDYNSVEVFKKLFPAMYKRGHRCMYEFIGYHDWSPELQWGYLLSHIHIARFNWPKSSVYRDLLRIGELKDNKYFIYTSNADGMFEQNGFPVDKILTTQGDYSRLQCLTPCSPDAVFPSLPYVKAAVPKVDPETQELTDSSLIPKCPLCNGKMMMNVRGGNWFLEGHFSEQRKKYKKFLQDSIAEAERKNKLVVILEIGCGFNTPTVIRVPMEQMTYQHKNVRLIRINTIHPEFPSEIDNKAVGITLDATEVVSAFRKALENNAN